MDPKYVIIGSLLFVVVFAFSIYPSESSIPPTNAIANIGTNDTYSNTGGWVNATNYKGTIYVITDGSIIVEPIQYTDDAE